MTQETETPEFVIPSAPCAWQQDLYFGREVELVPVGVGGVPRVEVASRFVGALARLLPSKPHSPEIRYDVFTPVGRIYQEMHEFVELAGPTCRSGEAVAWAYEATLEALSRVAVSAAGRTVVLCHTPSDYNDRTSRGQGRAHSTGCHFNMLSPRQLDGHEAHAFAALVSPLNAIFGPGGLTWSPDGALRFCCDPRAGHVVPLVNAIAHGEGPKPFLLARHEPYARPPFERLQCVAFGAPRSPLSSWLQAELLPWALRAVLARQTPPWCVADPIQALRAAPDEAVLLKCTSSGRSTSIAKAELAAQTVVWLAEFAETCVAGPEGAARIGCVRQLSLQAAAASADGTAQPPVVPTDIAIKRILFDRVAQTCGFADLAEIGCRAQAASSGDGDAAKAEEKLVVADVLFSSPSRPQSTYELAGRCGLFVRPRFEHPIQLPELVPLPAGIAPRDCARASLVAGLISGKSTRFCDWDWCVSEDGTTIQLPDPWCDLNS